jgi:hypothetical protein
VLVTYPRDTFRITNYSVTFYDLKTLFLY